MGAGHRARLPRHHLRLAGRRGGAADLRQEPRHVLPRRDRGAARPRVLDRPPRRAAGARRAAAPVGRRLAHRRRPIPAMAELIAQFMGPDTMLGKALGAPNNVFSDAEGGFNNPADPRRRDPRRQRRHQRPLPRPLLRRAHRHRRRRARPSRSSPRSRWPRPRSSRPPGPDKCLFFETTFGLGFFVASLFAPYGGERSFGHTGAGGSVGFTDPENGIGFGYVMNKMMAGPQRRPPLGRADQGRSTRPSASSPPTCDARWCPSRRGDGRRGTTIEQLAGGRRPRPRGVLRRCVGSRRRRWRRPRRRRTSGI